MKKRRCPNCNTTVVKEIITQDINGNNVLTIKCFKCPYSNKRLLK